MPSKYIWRARGDDCRELHLRITPTATKEVAHLRRFSGRWHVYRQYSSTPQVEFAGDYDQALARAKAYALGHIETWLAEEQQRAEGHKRQQAEAAEKRAADARERLELTEQLRVLLGDQASACMGPWGLSNEVARMLVSRLQELTPSPAEPSEYP